MAQLLVRTKNHWLDEVPKLVQLTWTQEEVDEYNRRSIRGDIIVVKDDDHIWGRREGLPDYVIVKIAGLSLNNAKHFEDALIIDDVVIRNRKYKIPEATLNEAMISDGVFEFSDEASFNSIVIDKSLY